MTRAHWIGNVLEGWFKAADATPPPPEPVVAVEPVATVEIVEHVEPVESPPEDTRTEAQKRRDRSAWLREYARKQQVLRLAPERKVES
jgi:hypothetical protein